MFSARSLSLASSSSRRRASDAASGCARTRSLDRVGAHDRPAPGPPRGSARGWSSAGSPRRCGAAHRGGSAICARSRAYTSTGSNAARRPRASVVRQSWYASPSRIASWQAAMFARYSASVSCHDEVECRRSRCIETCIDLASIRGSAATQPAGDSIPPLGELPLPRVAEGEQLGRAVGCDRDRAIHPQERRVRIPRRPASTGTPIVSPRSS